MSPESWRSNAGIQSRRERVRFVFTGDAELLRKLRRAQEVLKHKYPAGEMGSIFMEALAALLEKKDPEQRLKSKSESNQAGPTPGRWNGNPVLGSCAGPEGRRTRYVPLAVKNAVWRRDGGQCVYHEPGGERCLERGGLDYDHIVPWSLGGPSNNPKNIRLLCRAHNLMMARRHLGEAAVRRQFGRAAKSPRPGAF